MFQAVVDFLYEALFWFFSLCQVILSSFFDMLADLFYWVVDQFLTVVLWLLSLFPVDCSSFSLQQFVDGLPFDVLSVLYALGFPQAMGIVLAAFAAKFLLRLIPFVRLG